MATDLQRADGEIDETFAAGLSGDCRVRIPTEIQNEYDLQNTVLDAVVAQGDSSVAVTDAEVDGQGRFTVPAKKCDIYGIDREDTVEVVLDRVVLR